MALIRNLALAPLLLAAGYVIWVIILNLPGNEPASAPVVRSGSAPISAPAESPSSVGDRLPQPARAPGAGELVVPVAGIGVDQLVDSFADARGESRVHDAIDIMAPRGTPVIAAAGGTVEKLFDSERGGLTVYIRRSDGAWIDYYAHLEAYVPGLAEGLKVVQGQMIGLVGSTGDASSEAPHLHFAIHAMAPGESWWQGKAVNPYPLLTAGS